jgi:hypothetical protein
MHDHLVLNWRKIAKSLGENEKKVRDQRIYA